jgi:hypothetical protein
LEQDRELISLALLKLSSDEEELETNISSEQDRELISLALLKIDHEYEENNRDHQTINSALLETSVSFIKLYYQTITVLLDLSGIDTTFNFYVFYILNDLINNNIIIFITLLTDQKVNSIKTLFPSSL